jgi:hypothetical protein
MAAEPVPVGAQYRDVPTSSPFKVWTMKKPGTVVTMADVARSAGVSTMTVSNVINGRPRVGEATRERVLAAISELGYQVNLAARHLRAGRTGVVGLAVPEL